MILSVLWCIYFILIEEEGCENSGQVFRLYESLTMVSD